MTNKAKLMLALAMPTVVFAMLSVKDAHRFLNAGTVIPILLVAAIAEQINRRGAVHPPTRRVLSGVQVGGFVLGVSIFLAAGILRQ